MGKRYIDANALKVDYIVPSTSTGTVNTQYVSLFQILNAPTADVQKVVLCRDCVHGIPTRIDTVTGEFSDERYCIRHHMCHFGDYYCADGKRKENAMKCKGCKNYEHWFEDNYRCADSGTMVSEDDTCPYWRGKVGGAE